MGVLGTALAAAACLKRKTARSVPGGRIETVRVRSEALGVARDVVVYLPPSYDSTHRRYPTLYYLHGAGDNERMFMDRLHLHLVADSLFRAGLPEAILVMPDGDLGYWCDWASPDSVGETCSRGSPSSRLQDPAATVCVAHGRYETYVVREIVPQVDSGYRTLPGPDHRGIAGFSMGGYGAFWLVSRHPLTWGAAVSHSGLVAPLYVGPHPFDGHPRYASTVPEIVAAWPPGHRRPLTIQFGQDIGEWWARDPLRQLLQLQSSGWPIPRLYFDVGARDFLVDQNRAFAAALTNSGIPHTFTEWPGGHNQDYLRKHEGEGLAWLLRIVGQPDR